MIKDKPAKYIKETIWKIIIKKIENMKWIAEAF